ncbi:MAG: methylated-DNA--[protein]-cysteine S-methyltransferase [Candidatus Sedimenticola sp. 6PFRAG5]
MAASSAVSFLFDSPIGFLGVTIQNGALCSLDLSGGDAAERNDVAGDDGLPSMVVNQLESYFAHGGAGFTLPLVMAGTPFQKRVWEELKAIPPGEVRTYGEIATELGSSARAVGNACRKNPIPVVVPCHRVVSASGIGGFSGQTGGPLLDVKRWLLEHEGVAL